jgi:hypothetical protein
MQTQLKWHFLTIMLLFLLSFGQAQEKQPSFSITISAPQTTKTGQPVRLDVTVTNISSNRITLEFARAMAFDFLFSVQDSQGRAALETRKYQAIQGKDPHTTIWARLYANKSLLPGETLQFNTDLTELFDLKPDEYTVQLSRPLDSAPNPRAPKPSGPLVTSNRVSLAVTP